MLVNVPVTLHVGRARAFRKLNKLEVLIYKGNTTSVLGIQLSNSGACYDGLVSGDPYY